ncbi:MAG TPA: phage portal protein [Terriglobales bacterium]|nr:phage portal protein [Terriglobales bacterium]
MRGPFAGLARNAIIPPGHRPVARGTGGATIFQPPQLSGSGLKAYGRNSTLFPIVNRLALDTSNTTWHLYQPGASGEEDDRTEIKPTRHPAAQLWAHPNDFMTTQQFVEIGQQHLELTGEWYWLIVRSPSMRGVIKSMWPIRPDRMTPVPDDTTFLKGWLYRLEDGKEIALDLDEVIQIKMPNPDDMYRGIGPVQAAMIDIDSSRYSAEWNRNFFINGASPDGVLTVDHNLDDDDYNRIALRWREAHQGVSNAHRVAILEAGMQWEDHSFNHKDMQFTELRQLSADFIRQAFGFPTFMLGNVNDVNLANARASMAMYDAQCIDPRANRLKQTLNSQFLGLFGTNTRGLYFDYEPVVKADEQADATVVNTKALAAQILISSGFEADDVLNVVGLPPMVWREPEQQPLPGQTDPSEEGENEDAEGSDGQVNSPSSESEEGED